MALQYSTGLVNKMMGMQAIPFTPCVGANFAYVDGGSSADSITDAGASFVSKGWQPGRLLYTFGSTTSGNNLSAVPIVSVASGAITFATGTINTAETFAAGTVAIICNGGSLRDIFHKGVLRVFSGTTPATADAAITGTLLVEMTISSGTFVAGAFGNGLTFGAATAGVIDITAGEVWSGTAVAAGVATHYRFVGNASDTNALSTTLPRIQGTVGTSGTDGIIPNTSITLGQTIGVSSWPYTWSPT